MMFGTDTIKTGMFELMILKLGCINIARATGGYELDFMNIIPSKLVQVFLFS